MVGDAPDVPESCLLWAPTTEFQVSQLPGVLVSPEG